MIVAVAEDGVIGHQGGLPWHLSPDLRHFRRVTMGHPMVMGRLTWDSIGRPLPGRESVVISRQPGFRAEGARVSCGVEDGLALAERLARERGVEEIMVIGGAQLFEAVRPRADRIYLTRIHARFPGDVLFAPVDPDLWELVSSSERLRDDRSGLDYTFLVLDRRRSHPG